MRTAVLILLVAATAAAQSTMTSHLRFHRDPDPGDGSDMHPGPDHRDNGVTVCRVRFASNRHEAAGKGWPTDYPRASQNLSTRLPEITTIRVDERQPWWVVDIGSPGLHQCPLGLISDGGTMALSGAEVANVQAYLEKGGLLFFDDSWGSRAWAQLLTIFEAIAPGGVLTTPDFDHPLYWVHYRIRETLQMPNLGFWEGMPEVGVPQRQVAERGEDSPETPLQLLHDRDGRVVAVVTHNTDVADAWEEESSSHAYFDEFAADGYAHGVNVYVYAMTH